MHSTLRIILKSCQKTDKLFLHFIDIGTPFMSTPRAPVLPFKGHSRSSNTLLTFKK